MGGGEGVSGESGGGGEEGVSGGVGTRVSKWGESN